MKLWESAWNFIHKELINDMEEDNNLFDKVKKIFTGDKEDDHVAEEIISMLDEGHEQGVFVGSEAEMIRNIFEYADKDAKDIMTHRKNIIGLDGEETIEDTLSFILEQSYSRFPVYVDDIDNIVGIMHIRDAMNCYFDESLRFIPIKDLKDYIRPTSYIPETKSIDSLFKQMQSEKNHLAVVLDEYGQTSGLVAMEDILEEIVGNIFDEYDEEEHHIEVQLDGTYIIDGMTELEDIEDSLGIVFDKKDYETLNGFMIYQLEHIPAEDETCMVEHDGFCFTVMSVENNIIQQVRAEQIAMPTKE